MGFLFGPQVLLASSLNENTEHDNHSTPFSISDKRQPNILASGRIRKL